MKVIGLTGSIASGKTTAARHLEGRGAHRRRRRPARSPVPTNRARRRLPWRSRSPSDPSSPEKDGHIDRHALGARVFARSGGARALDRHRLARDSAARRESGSRTIRVSERNGVIVLEATVLLEAGWEDLVDEDLGPSRPTSDTALRRAVLRDGSGRGGRPAANRFAQLSNEERARRARHRVSRTTVRSRGSARAAPGLGVGARDGRLFTRTLDLVAPSSAHETPGQQAAGTGRPARGLDTRTTGIVRPSAQREDRHRPPVSRLPARGHTLGEAAAIPPPFAGMIEAATRSNCAQSDESER